MIKIKKGLDIPMDGAPDPVHTPDGITTLYGIVPDDFPGHKWKCTVKPGDQVLAGTPLMMAKEHEALRLVSPVAGTVAEVRRGERRKIEAVVIEAGADKSRALEIEGALKATDRESILRVLCHSGMLAMIRQRPFDIVPDPTVTPRDIFVSAFDSAPLAAPLISADMREAHEKGLEVLRRLTDGNVYLSVRADDSLSSRVAKVYEIGGPHPSGNVGVQIAHIKPVNRGEVVWTLDSRTVVRIGRLFATGRVDCAAEVAVTGPLAKRPHIVDTRVGAGLHTLLKGEVKMESGTVRVVSGNVLTGVQVQPEEGFLRYPYRQITLLSEGDRADEFLGWASLDPRKFSVKRTFLSSLLGKRGHYDYDARLRGGRRGMILSGEMDKVFPMDIYPEFLLKAIMAGDIERMEQLGIYEVAPEDFALAEFVDTSKQPLQQIVRDGLDRLRANLT